MTIGAYNKLKAIIDLLPKEVVLEPEPNRYCAIIEHWGIRINWTDAHDRISVYLWPNERGVYHGNATHADVDKLQNSVLDAVLFDLRLLTDGCGLHDWTWIEEPVIRSGRIREAVF